MLKPIADKSDNAIIAEWDAISAVRDAEIRTRTDISYWNILFPLITELGGFSAADAVLDAGCGSGNLSLSLSPICRKVVGVDPSHTAIDIALQNCQAINNVAFVRSTIEDFALSAGKARFDVVIANMLFQACPHLDNCLAAIRSLLAPAGAVVATIPHPWFWPYYWQYASEPWFSYHQEIGIEAPLKTSHSPSGAGVTTHFHRPLSRYAHAFEKNGFVIVNAREPMPSKEVEVLYPSPWRFPRFLGLSLRLAGNA